MCVHVYTCVDAYGCMKRSGVFSSCSPLHFPRQSLLLNPKLNDSARLASLLATGCQSLSLILKS